MPLSVWTGKYLSRSNSRNTAAYYKHVGRHIYISLLQCLLTGNSGNSSCYLSYRLVRGFFLVWRNPGTLLPYIGHLEQVRVKLCCHTHTHEGVFVLLRRTSRNHQMSEFMILYAV